MLASLPGKELLVSSSRGLCLGRSCSFLQILSCRCFFCYMLAQVIPGCCKSRVLCLGCTCSLYNVVIMVSPAMVAALSHELHCQTGVWQLPGFTGLTCAVQQSIACNMLAGPPQPGEPQAASNTEALIKLFQAKSSSNCATVDKFTSSGDA